MKKLRVILPAILTLAVSTSAAVTGTVAWFTATRLRTITMDNITAVNPEEGLKLVSLTNDTNVKFSYVDSNGVPNDNAHYPAVTHAWDASAQEEANKQAYLRDASVDVANGKVYKAKLSEGGEVVGYEIQNIGTADTKTFNGKKVFYATSFDANFKVARVDSGYDFQLFLDINQSKATRPAEETTDALKNNSIYNGIRFGFKTDDNWFVWAPFTQTEIGDANTGWTVSKYVSGPVTVDQTHSLADAETLYTSRRFVKGNDDNTDKTTATALNDSTTLIPNSLISTESTKVTTEYGWLGSLSTTPKAVTVYTWFEGCEEDVKSDNFTNALSGLTSDLKFIMRRVAKAQQQQNP